MSKMKITNDNKKYWVNVSGTSERSPKCKCGSWKKHWENYSGEEWPDKCCVEGCNKTAVLGAHIRKDSSRKEYIAPLCNSHNQKDDLLTLKDGTTIVNANQSETCK